MFFTLSLIALSKLTFAKSQLTMYSGICGFLFYILFYIFYIGQHPEIYFILRYIICIDLVISIVVLNTLLVSTKENLIVEKTETIKPEIVADEEQTTTTIEYESESGSDSYSFHDTDIDTQDTIDTQDILEFKVEQPPVVPT